MKLKENYPDLLAKKIENTQKIINNSKPYIKITTKGPFYKQIIISIGKENANKFMISTSNYVTNINKALKSIKSDIMADYIQKKPIDVTIVTNKIALSSNIQVIENFVKNVEKSTPRILNYLGFYNQNPI